MYAAIVAFSSMAQVFGLYTIIAVMPAGYLEAVAEIPVWIALGVVSLMVSWLLVSDI